MKRAEQRAEITRKLTEAMKDCDHNTYEDVAKAAKCGARTAHTYITGDPSLYGMYLAGKKRIRINKARNVVNKYEALLAEGLTHRQVASRLAMSVPTYYYSLRILA